MSEKKLETFRAMIGIPESAGEDTRETKMIREMWEDEALRAGATYIPKNQKLKIYYERRWLGDGTPNPMLRVEGLASRS